MVVWEETIFGIQLPVVVENVIRLVEISVLGAASSVRELPDG